MKTAPDRVVVLAREARIRNACQQACELCDLRFLRDGVGWAEVRALLPLQALVLSTSFPDWMNLLYDCIELSREPFPILLIARPEQRNSLPYFVRLVPRIRICIPAEQEGASYIQELVLELERLLREHRTQTQKKLEAEVAQPGARTLEPRLAELPSAVASAEINVEAVEPSGGQEGVLAVLREQNNGLIAEVAAARVERDAIRSTLDQQAASLTESRTQVERLTGELAEARANQQQVAEERAQERSQSLELVRQLAVQARRLEELTQTERHLREEAHARSADQESQAQAHRQELQRERQRALTARQEQQALQTKLSVALQAQLESAAQLGQLRSELSQLQAELAEAAQDRVQSQAFAEELRAHLREVQTRQLEQELARQHQERMLVEHQVALTERTRELEAANTELRASRQELVEEQQRTARFEAMLEQASLRQLKLEEELGATRQALGREQQGRMAVEAELTHAAEQSKTQLHEITELRALLEFEEERRISTEDETSSLTGQLARLGQELLQRELERDELRGLVLEREAEQEALRSALMIREGELAVAERAHRASEEELVARTAEREQLAADRQRLLVQLEETRSRFQAEFAAKTNQWAAEQATLEEALSRAEQTCCSLRVELTSQIARQTAAQHSLQELELAHRALRQDRERLTEQLTASRKAEAEYTTNLTRLQQSCQQQEAAEQRLREELEEMWSLVREQEAQTHHREEELVEQEQRHRVEMEAQAAELVEQERRHQALLVEQERRHQALLAEQAQLHREEWVEQDRLRQADAEAQALRQRAKLQEQAQLQQAELQEQRQAWETLTDALRRQAQEEQVGWATALAELIDLAQDLGAGTTTLRAAWQSVRAEHEQTLRQLHGARDDLATMHREVSHLRAAEQASRQEQFTQQQHLLDVQERLAEQARELQVVQSERQQLLRELDIARKLQTGQAEELARLSGRVSWTEQRIRELEGCETDASTRRQAVALQQVRLELASQKLQQAQVHEAAAVKELQALQVELTDSCAHRERLQEELALVQARLTAVQEELAELRQETVHWVQSQPLPVPGVQAAFGEIRSAAPAVGVASAGAARSGCPRRGAATPAGALGRIIPHLLTPRLARDEDFPRTLLGRVQPGAAQLVERSADRRNLAEVTLELRQCRFLATHQAQDLVRLQQEHQALTADLAEAGSKLQEQQRQLTLARELCTSLRWELEAAGLHQPRSCAATGTTAGAVDEGPLTQDRALGRALEEARIHAASEALELAWQEQARLAAETREAQLRERLEQLELELALARRRIAEQRQDAHRSVRSAHGAWRVVES